MEDFPIWLKLVIWGTIGLTVLYTIWGMIHSYLQCHRREDEPRKPSAIILPSRLKNPPVLVLANFFSHRP